MRGPGHERENTPVNGNSVGGWYCVFNDWNNNINKFRGFYFTQIRNKLPAV